MSPLGRIPLCRIRPHTATHTLWAWPVLTVSQPESQFQLLTNQQQSRLIATGGHTQPTQGTLQKHTVQVKIKTVPLGLTGYLLHKATQPSLGDVKDLFCTKKQI